MATRSSSLAWRISWTEEPGRIQSMGSEKSRTRLSEHSLLGWQVDYGRWILRHSGQVPKHFFIVTSVLVTDVHPVE